MTEITSPTTLRGVKYVRIGHGVLDFGTDEDEYTWWCREDADWRIEGGETVVNDGEDRAIVEPPNGQTFTCEITASSGENDTGPVVCRLE